MEVGKIYENVSVIKICIERDEVDFSLLLSFLTSNEKPQIKLSGVRDLDNIAELMDADRLWVNEEEMWQQNFGRFTLGVSSECFSEIQFDSLHEHGV